MTPPVRAEPGLDEGLEVWAWKRVANQMHRARCDTRFADLKIVCQEETFHIHKCVICPQSDFFDRACNGNFEARELKESISIYCEAMTDTIKFDDEDSRFVEEMVNFFYTSDYNLPANREDCINVDCDDGDEAIAKDVLLYRKVMKTSATFAQPLFHVYMYALADRLLIPALKELAIWKLKSLNKPGDTFSPYLIDMVRSVYTLTPPSDRGMREIIIGTVSDWMDRLRSVRHPILQPEFFDEVPQFARDLLVMVMNKLPAVPVEVNNDHLPPFVHLNYLPPSAPPSHIPPRASPRPFPPHPTPIYPSRRGGFRGRNHLTHIMSQNSYRTRYHRASLRKDLRALFRN
ncbi:uncharacterized protein N7483_008042 [Penicillium malachiteum]|uniref:uncharacterized protein n=1 Tax=Penicillium malachiteum TaxID=1324776 RepID=UPI002546EEF3|nr:uncharacterized protein N7483_008042 [Penicillium malachiteum]KAJ5726685.1 hypothetical protein N7483_008042 [Penicillium malachiteum]